MRMLRSNVGRAVRAAAAVSLALGGASVAQAQWWPSSSSERAPERSQLLFEWQGRVDREARFEISRRGVDVRGDDGRGRLRTRNDLPRGEGRLIVQRLDGRGNVEVVQQPTSSNRGNGRGYGNTEGVVRIRDSRGGADTYRIRVYWQPTGQYSSNGRYDGDDRNGRRGDDRYDDRRRP